jgi:RING-box protein 1
MDRFTIKSIHLIASSHLNIENDICSICTYDLYDKCTDCIDTNNKCISVLGKCNHSYHLHCIDKWIKIKNICPLDKLPWICLTKNSK